MVLAMSFGTMLPGFAILPATVPAVVLVGVSETLYGISSTYGSWLLLHFPVLGLLKAIAIALIVIKLFPDTPRAAPPPANRFGNAVPSPRRTRAAGSIAKPPCVWNRAPVIRMA